MGKYYITAKITAKAGQEAALKAAIVENIPKVRAEQGCERYDLLVSREQPHIFLFDEIWSDKAAFEAHGKAPHMAVHRERTKSLVACPTELDIWQAADVVA